MDLVPSLWLWCLPWVKGEPRQLEPQSLVLCYVVLTWSHPELCFGFSILLSVPCWSSRMMEQGCHQVNWRSNVCSCCWEIGILTQPLDFEWLGFKRRRKQMCLCMSFSISVVSYFKVVVRETRIRTSCITLEEIPIFCGKCGKTFTFDDIGGIFSSSLMYLKNMILQN